MPKRIAHIWLFFFFYWLCPVSAQQIQLRNYSVEDGVPHPTIYRIFQDRKGFLWLCTDNGFSIFDGHTFRNYSSNDGLSDNTVLSVSEDRNGEKLICTYRGGLYRFRNDRPEKYNEGNTVVPKSLLYAVRRQQYLWLITGDTKSLYRIEGNRRVPMSIKNNNGQQAQVIRLIQENNDLYITTSAGVYRVVHDSLIAPLFPDIIGDSAVTAMCPGHSGGYWFGLGQHIVYIKDGKQQINISVPGEPGFGDILADRNGNVWVTANGKVYLVQQGKIHEISAALNIPSVYVNDIFEDNEGNIWFATHGAGVYRFSTLQTINYPVGLAPVHIYCEAIAPVAPGEYWVGSIGMLSRYKNGALQKIHCSNLSSTEYIYFIEVSNGFAYIGASGKLLKKRITPPYDETMLRLANSSSFGAISFCKKGTDILAGSYNNVYKLVNDHMELYTTWTPLASKRCNALLADEKGCLWIGTDSGVIKECNGQFTYEATGLKAEPLIYGIYQDSRHRLWFTTPEGLICREGSHVRRFTTADGLAHNSCKAFLEHNGRLWIGTLKGINYTDVDILAIKKYPIDNSLTEILSLQMDSTRLLAGTISGLSVSNTGASRSPVHIPLYITSVKTPDSVYSSPQKLYLPYRKGNIEISFTGILFNEAFPFHYEYRIVDLDDRWKATQNNSIELSSIPPGDYVFELRARDESGTAGPVRRLPVTITRPLWLQPWFAIIAMVAFLSVFYVVIRWRIEKREKKKRTQLMAYNHMVYLKQQALSALINPHFIFNCMNSILHYLNKKDAVLAKKYLTDFAHLIRMILEDVQEASISLERELERLKLYLSLEQLRFGDDLSYTFYIGEGIDVAAVKIPNMLLQPYIENAIWHGIMPKQDKGLITISFSLADNDLIRITIEDDGIGIYNGTSQKNHKPSGILLTERRLQLLGRLMKQYMQVDIQPRAGTQGGTIVTIIVPAHLNEKELIASDHFDDMVI